MLSKLSQFTKPYLLITAVCLILLVVLWWKPVFMEPPGVDGSAAIPLHRGLSFLVETDPGLRIRLMETTISEEALLRQSSYNYIIMNRNQEIGRITLTCQDLPNGDVLFFAESRGAATESHSYQGCLTLSSPAPTIGRALVYPQGKPVLGQSAWQTFAPQNLKSHLPEGLIFLDGRESSLALGPVDIIKDLGNGVLKELQTLPVSLNQNRNQSEYRFPLSNTQGGMIRCWGVVSDESLVNWDNETDISSIRVADLNQARKFWLDGVYDTVPFSYVPTDPRGFWRCPAQHVGRSFLTKESRFTYAIAVSSMYGSADTQNDRGYWPTRPQSNWLAGDYGFGPGFYDTRFNTDAALFLLEAYRQYGEDKALVSARRYAGFLCAFARESAYRSENGGYLVPDYQDASGRGRTHTSLNHLLAEMNFLYEMYLTTNNKEYRETADKMLQAVKDTRDEWIKDSGELWYSRLPNGEYGFEDYPTLTLNDLRQSQRLMAEIYGGPDPDLARLIAAKEAFNRANGLPLR